MSNLRVTLLTHEKNKLQIPTAERGSILRNGIYIVKRLTCTIELYLRCCKERLTGLYSYTYDIRAKGRKNHSMGRNLRHNHLPNERIYDTGYREPSDTWIFSVPTRSATFGKHTGQIQRAGYTWRTYTPKCSSCWSMCISTTSNEGSLDPRIC